MKFQVGQKIKFRRGKQRFTVRACNERFAICTKPFNPRHTVIYTIIDLEEGVRGTENLVFGMGAETDQQCQEMLTRLTTPQKSGIGFQTEVSHRNRIDLDIESIEEPKPKKRTPKDTYWKLARASMRSNP